MPNHVVIYYGASAAGQLRADTFFLDRSGVLETDQGLDIIVQGDITIYGVIRGKEQSGASIRLTSVNGKIFMNGFIQAGSGKDYHDQAPLPRPHGIDGGNGGSVELLAPRDCVIVDGEIHAGKGGRGQDAIELEGAADERIAFSGAGGHGGSITIAAGREIAILHGMLKAGHGGSGGRARAGFWTFEQLLQAITEAIPPVMGWEPELLIPTDPLPPSPRKALADSGSGGMGGSVHVKLAGLGAVVRAPVTAGNGGATAHADATWAEVATARARDGGRGGDVTIDLGAAGVLNAAGAALTPGNGGPCGETLDTRRATAGARNQAVATVGLGGIAGAYRKNNDVQAKGAGGNAGSARAATDGCFKDQPGANARGAAPGIGGHARCP